jgi:hypothetical protein
MSDFLRRNPHIDAEGLSVIIDCETLGRERAYVVACSEMDGENTRTPRALFQAARAAYTVFWGEDVEILIAT